MNLFPFTYILYNLITNSIHAWLAKGCQVCVGWKKQKHFLWWVVGDNGYWWLSTICCSKFPIVRQWVRPGGLCKSFSVWGKADDCSRSTRKMSRSTQNLLRGSQMLDGGCSVVHPYYYCNHNMWPQIYSKLLRAMDGLGSLVECTTTIPIHFIDAAQSM